eukprot:g16492.t1
MLGPRNAIKVFGVVAALCCAGQASAGASTGPLYGIRSGMTQTHQGRGFGNMNRRRLHMEQACSPVRGRCVAAAIPGDSFAGEVVVGGLLNFLSIYNILITGRVLLSWVPQLQGVQALQPVFLLTDPYLNAFRRLNLTVGGLDFSVLPAFFLLSFATNAVASLGAELPPPMKRGVGWLAGRQGALSSAMSGRLAPASSFGASSSPAANTVIHATAKTRRPLFAFRV